jgi:hypothetical protein
VLAVVVAEDITEVLEVEGEDNTEVVAVVV